MNLKKPGHLKVRKSWHGRILGEAQQHRDDLMMEIQDAARKIQKLEHELQEMTIALSQAWDKLVPFLQEVPAEINHARDMEPILQAVVAAVDSEMSGIYLLHDGEWFSVPDAIPLPDDIRQQLATIQREQKVSIQIDGKPTSWLFIPIFSEGNIIGTLGIGTELQRRAFTSVDLRIITRMAERVGNQVAAAQLARIREREVIHHRELQIASAIQKSIQPSSPPDLPGVDFSSYWQPAKDVGGDAWGWVQQSTGKLAWFVLDVSGKGLPAALAAVSLHTALRMALRSNLSPVEVLQIVNDEFYEPYSQTDLMATAAVLRIDLQSGDLEIANAGHPPVLVRQHGKWSRIAATAPPIGVLPDLDVEMQHVYLACHDLVICHSDGFSEIEVRNGLWGQTGILNAIPSGAKDVQALTRHIVKAAHRAGPVHDDQSLVSARYFGAKKMNIQITIPATLQDVSQFSEQLEGHLDGLPLDIRTGIILGIQELCVNIVKHAYDGTEGTIAIVIDHTPTSVIIETIDHASNIFEMPATIQEPDMLDLPEGGMGLFIMHQTFEQVEYTRLPQTNRWRLSKTWGK